MIKVILYQLRSRMKSCFFVMIELLVVFVVSMVLMDRLLPFLEEKHAYQKLDLSNIVCFTTRNEEFQTNDEWNYLGRNLYGREYIGSDGMIYIQPVSEEYIKYIEYEYADYMYEQEKKTSVYQAVIVESQKDDYQIGSTYSVQAQDGGNVIEFMVIGILESDYVFLPPDGNGDSFLINKEDNLVLLIDDGTLERYFDATDIHMIWADSAEDAKRIVEELWMDTKVVLAMSGIEAIERRESIELEMIGMPLVLFFISTVLGLAGLVSHVLLSIIRLQRNYGIYFIFGYTMQRCHIVQMITDIIPVILSFGIGMGIYWGQDNFQLGIIQNQTASIGLSIFVILVIYMLSEWLGYAQLKNGNIIERLERS